jgi:hypothetical protein
MAVTASWYLRWWRLIISVFPDVRNFLWSSILLNKELPMEFHPANKELPMEFHAFNEGLLKESLIIGLEVPNAPPWKLPFV